MKSYSLNVLREKFLSFFESKGHLKLDSFPLVPQNDKSLLLINAGMAPLKPYFTGAQVPPRKRVTTCQKCIRTADIERVGITARHGTFFEMLGNFSFGDYFKREAIPWAWEFLTKVLEIPEELLSVSVYLDDDEARDIWLQTGVPAERIYKMGKEDNFWEIGAGPCGPCSEIYFDRGEKYGCGKPDCRPGCDCDRYIELWNIVFTQFNCDGEGHYSKLEHPNIDTGMGLERLACVMQGVDNLFEVDTIRKVMMRVCEYAGVTYEASRKDSDVSLRVVTDHIRSTVFLVSDGVLPSNEGRGYVLRRLLRRAARHGRMLGIKGLFLSDLADTVIGESAAGYPELAEKRDYIKQVISTEEERFAQTVDAGLLMLQKLIDRAVSDGLKRIEGADAFKLYDTYGFPPDLTREMCAEKGVGMDEDGFSALMLEQKERARKARSFAADYMGGADYLSGIPEDAAKTEFAGYEVTECEAAVIGIVKDNEAVSEISGGNAVLLLDRTPFYAESGGQVGDTGVIVTKTGVFAVADTKKTAAGQYLHFGSVAKGRIALGKARAEVSRERRAAIARNHSAAHLLQAALRRVLGKHVEQAGSYVDEHRLRFDFTHFKALTGQELCEVERLVNGEILKGEPIGCEVMSVDEAKKSGAMALFGEKYGDRVRVVKMGDFSKELCGGTHLDNTAKAGLFVIVSESSVAAGVRRIEAVTGCNVLALLKKEQELTAEVAAALKAADKSELVHRAESAVNEARALKKELEVRDRKAAAAKVKEACRSAADIGGVKLVTACFEGLPAEALRAAADGLRESEPLAVCVLASADGGKVTLAAGCGREAVAKGANAGLLLKAVSPICRGGGGGRADSAVSGGRDASKTGEALAAVEGVLKEQVGD